MREGLPADLPAAAASAPVAAAAHSPVEGSAVPAESAVRNVPAAKSEEPAQGISESRKAILDDERLNSMLEAFPGSSVVGIKDGN